MQCGSARHLPSSGAQGAPGSARCRRAPAIAFTPRTASGKASSVLTCCRRVCGRLCTAPGMVLGLVLNSLPGWPAGRRVGTSGCRKSPVRPPTFGMQRNRHSPHASERPFWITGLQSTGWFIERVFNGHFRSLNWDCVGIPCEGNHKVPGRRVVFESIRALKICLIS